MAESHEPCRADRLDQGSQLGLGMRSQSARLRAWEHAGTHGLIAGSINSVTGSIT
jgi:hypothetical protein